MDTNDVRRDEAAEAGFPPAPPDATVEAGSGRTAVRLELSAQGRDLLLRVTGGLAHVGAVAVQPGGEAGQPPPPVAEIVVGDHKEGPLARECARAVGLASGRTCVCAAGIHQDRATPREIAAITANVRTALDELLRRLAAAGTGDLLERRLVRWCREGGEIARALFRRTGDLEFKTGHEAVTEADRRIETLLRQRIAAAYPRDHVVGEEYGGEAGPAGGRTWQLDPIDGTLNFALGLPGFCTSVAVLAGERILAACVYQPLTGDAYTARAGAGARLNGEPIRVSGRARLREAILSAQLKRDGRFARDPRLLQALHLAPLKLRRTGAIALELAWLAAGAYDVLVAGFGQAIQLYDVAAGILLVEEAQGKVTDAAGRPYRAGGCELVASNGLLHAETLALLAPGNAPEGP